MIFERAELLVKPGHESAFAEILGSSALAQLRSAEGCLSVKTGQGVEAPGKFILMLEWESVERHLAFTRTDAFAAFQKLVAPHLGGPASMEHFEPL